MNNNRHFFARFKVDELLIFKVASKQNRFLVLNNKKEVQSLKAGTSPELENVPSELIKLGGKAPTPVITLLCQKTRGEDVA